MPQMTEDTRKMVHSITELSQELRELGGKANMILSNDMNSDTVPHLESLTQEAKMTLYNLNKVLESISSDRQGCFSVPEDRLRPRRNRI